MSYLPSGVKFLQAISEHRFLAVLVQEGVALLELVVLTHSDAEQLGLMYVYVYVIYNINIQW